MVGLVVVAGGCAIEGEKEGKRVAPIAGAVSQPPTTPATAAPPTSTPTAPVSTTLAVKPVTSIGTKVVVEAEEEGGCDLNYSGACVPIASDVDCSSGSGNGPAYVVGPVQVVGRDIYGLDGNNDGVGCENG